MYTVISFLILLFSYYLFKRVSGSLKLTQLNMISWIFYYNLILQSFIASVLVVNNVDHHYLIGKIHNDEARLYGWLAVQYTMVAMPLGMLFVIKLFGYKNNINLFQQYVYSPIKPLFSKKDSYIKYPLYIMYIISILSVFYVFFSLKHIPIKGVIQGLASEVLSGLRQEASRDFSGNQYIKNIFSLGLTPILSYIAYSYYKMSRNYIDKLWFIVLFFSSILILTYNLEKAPLVSYFLGFLFLNILIKGSVKKRTIYIFFGISLSLIILMYFFIAGASRQSVLDLLLNYNLGITGRIILTQAAGTYLSFDLFPNIVPYIGIHSISNFIDSIFGLIPSERSARILMENYEPNAVKAGVAGVINSLFIAEAWANFGLVGVLIAPIYVGMIIQTLYMFFLTKPKTPILLGLFTYFSYRGSITGGFNDYIYNAGYIITFFIFLWLYFNGYILKKLKRKNK